MLVLTVSETSNPNELTNAVAGALRADEPLTLEATGAEAITLMARAVMRVRRLNLPQRSTIMFTSEVHPVAESDRDEPFVRFVLASSARLEREEPVDTSAISAEIKAQFDAWERLPDDHNELFEKIRLHHAESPILSGGDVDAAWDQADVGEETVGGTAPTPDQDVVEELGEAVGLTYEDDEPLRSGEKLEERDRERWELDPASAEEESP